MGKKNKLSILSDADEASLKGLSNKKRAVAVDGKPDQTDIDNLTILFETYNKAQGGRLMRMMKQNAVERSLNNIAITEKPIDTAAQLSFWMPKDLQEVVEEYWPTIWTNKAHLRWFLGHFPGFRR